MSASKSEKRGLGRGLSALMGDVPADSSDTTVDATLSRADATIDIDKLSPNPAQPRRDFSTESLEELARSIQARGILQPLIIRPSNNGSGRYEIVAGERRWRAAQLAQLHDVPVIIRELTDAETLEVAIIENIQRANLNPVEEAMGYRELMEHYGHTQERLATALGKSRSHIANLLRLLTLPEEVQAHIRSGELSSGHARALVTADNPADLAREIMRKGLSVRQVEGLQKSARSRKASGKASGGSSTAKDADTRALEQDLSANLGMSVVIEHSETTGEGRMSIKYATLEQLDQLCQVLSYSR